MCIIWETWPLTVSCFQAASVIPLTVPQTILIKDDCSWGPGSTGAEPLNRATDSVHRLHTSSSVHLPEGLQNGIHEARVSQVAQACST